MAKPPLPFGVYQRPAAGPDHAGVRAFIQGMRAQAKELASSGRIWEAIEACNHAIVANPGDPALLLSKAVLLQRAGDPKQALGVLNRALGMAPEDVPIHYQGAVALASLGRHAEALEHLRFALKREPELRFEAAKDPYLAVMRSDPAFRELVGQGGFR